MVELGQLWDTAAILLGFQVTSFSWRLSRELAVRDTGDQIWFPFADRLNLASLVLTVFGVFIFPVLGWTNSEAASKCFGAALILFMGYPFALAGHYRLFSKVRSGKETFCPRQEFIALILCGIVFLAYCLLIVGGKYPASTAGEY